MKASTAISKSWFIPRKDQIPTQELLIATRISKVLATSNQEDRASAQVWRRFMEIVTITKRSKKVWGLKILKRIPKELSSSYLLISSSSSLHLKKILENTRFRRWHNSLHLKTLTTFMKVSFSRSIRSRSKVHLRTTMTIAGLALYPKSKKGELTAMVTIT